MLVSRSPSTEPGFARRQITGTRPAGIPDHDREQHRVEAVEQPAVGAEDVADVLDPEVALTIDSKRSPTGASAATQAPMIRASVPFSQSW